MSTVVLQAVNISISIIYIVILAVCQP